MATIQGEVKHKVAEAVEGPATGPIYVTIPARDIFDYAFPDVWINDTRYPAGHTYALEPETAKAVQTIVTGRQKHDLGLMSNRINLDALRQLASGEALPGSAKAANGGTQVPVFDAGRLNTLGINI